MDEQTQNNSEEMVPKAELEQCAKERDEYLGGWQRAKADFVNYKKEESRRTEEMSRYQMEDIIRDLITVLDNFDLGIAALEKQGPIEKGIYMIRTQIKDILKQRGAEEIPLKPGDPYDPSVAEAIAEGESSESPPGSILEVIETGYRLTDRVVRPARVRIVKDESRM